LVLLIIRTSVETNKIEVNKKKQKKVAEATFLI